MHQVYNFTIQVTDAGNTNNVKLFPATGTYTLDVGCSTTTIIESTYSITADILMDASHQDYDAKYIFINPKSQYSDGT
jgi:hypothetical protein